MLKPNFLTGEASAEWDRILPLVTDASELDSRVLAAYCMAIGSVIEAEATIKKEGSIITTDRGNIIPNPSMGIRNRSMTLALTYAKECGFTPRSRGEQQKKKKKLTVEDMLK